LSEPRQAILLLAHGTPDVLGDMSAYLQFVTSGRAMPQHVVEELQHRYAEIGLREEPLPEGPPLTRWTLLQGRLLAERTGTPVYVGMRNWHPFIEQAVQQMRTDGITQARVLCLAPQNSRTSTGLYRRALETALDKVYADAPEARFTYTFTAGWAEHPKLALAFAETLWPVWAQACAEQRAHVPVLFTAHSVPCRTIRSTTSAEAAQGSATEPGAAPPAEGIQNYGTASAGDPYPVEAKRTAAAVAGLMSAVGLREADWFFAFQSQGVAGAPWIGPSVEDTLKALADSGHKAVLLQPIGFLCDHVEILYDIDVAFTQTAKELGMSLYRAASLNDSQTLIDALETLTAPQD
jgi:ferrochelatase